MHIRDKEIKLIIADIDGTLTNYTNEISPETRKALQYIHEKGILFGIASGRSIDMNLPERIRKWNLGFEPDMYVGMNGCQLLDNVQGKRTDLKLLKKEWIREIIEMMWPISDNPSIYVGKETWLLKITHFEKEAVKRWGSIHHIVNDVSELWQNDNAKIIYRLEDEKIPEVIEYVNAHKSPYYKAFRTSPEHLEFSDATVSKATALEHFCQENGISLENVAAFGDATNDNEMLEVSGWGICLLNGTDDTKQAADIITDEDIANDGFSKFIFKELK